MRQPVFQGIDVVYKGKADNKDIRDLLEKLVPTASEQMRDYAKKFKGNSELETCKNIFNFLKNDLSYIADGNEQIIKLPSALLKTKVGDCKSYSLFTASILDNLGIPYTITYASYNDNPIPHHVYIVTKSGIIIDAVYGIFNKEKQPKYKYKKNMNVRYMAGMDCDCDNSGVGKITLINKDKRQAIKSGVKNVASKVSQGSKTISLAPARGMFMTLISLNVDGFASKLSKTNTTNLLNSWYKLGGDRTKLAEAISKGASRPAKKLGFLPKLKKIIGNTKVNGMGATEIPSGIKAQIVALCTTAGTSIGGSPTGTSVGASMGGVVVAVLPNIIDAIKQVPVTEVTDAPLDNLDLTSDIASESASETASDTGSKSSLSLTSPKVLIPLALLVGAGVYFVTKKK
jgi:hypothetical protein